MVKIFTMVKGEVDIVKDWVLYHGNMFGFNNLYIIDNYSKDGTYEKLLEFEILYNINVFRYEDYKKKGEYMTLFLKRFSKNEHVFPIDIDEFIVFYDKEKNMISCDNQTILNYIQSLPILNAYKMNYILSKILTENGYERAAVEAEIGSYMDYGKNAKTFFHSSLFKGVIDHGNHYHMNSYYLTKLCLVHFHCRNLDQMKKKVYNNVKGFGYDPFNLIKLKETIARHPNINGFHHINNQINILENKFKLDISDQGATGSQGVNGIDINLKSLSNKILSICDI